jgi:hypothetical protein
MHFVKPPGPVPGFDIVVTGGSFDDSIFVDPYGHYSTRPHVRILPKSSLIGYTHKCVLTRAKTL